MRGSGSGLRDDAEPDLDGAFDAFDLDPRGPALDLDAHHGDPDDGPATGERSPSAERTGLARRLGRWPDGAPPWARGPGVVLLAAVLGAALVGGLVAHRAGARLDERVAERTALLAVAVGSVELEGVLTGAAGAPGGEVGSAAVVTIVNRGEEPVQVELTGLFAPLQVPAERVDPVEVGAEGTEVVRVPLDLDCADVPVVTGRVATNPVGRAQEWVTARVGEPGEPLTGAQQRLPISQPQFDLGDQLGWACESRSFEAVTGTPLDVTEDGRLLVRVDNTSSSTMVVIGQDAPGTDLSTDPSLPLPLGSGESAVLALSLGVDCAQVGDALSLSYGSVVDLLASADDGNPTPEDGGYSVMMGEPTIGTWAATGVGAACGVTSIPRSR